MARGRFAASSDDSIEGVLADADEVFRYSADERPQDRAHEYLEWRGLARTATDTAMQAAVRDMVRRARAARCGDAPDRVAGEVGEAARISFDLACRLGAIEGAMHRG